MSWGGGEKDKTGEFGRIPKERNEFQRSGEKIVKFREDPSIIKAHEGSIEEGSLGESASNIVERIARFEKLEERKSLEYEKEKIKAEAEIEVLKKERAEIEYQRERERERDRELERHREMDRERERENVVEEERKSGRYEYPDGRYSYEKHSGRVAAEEHKRTDNVHTENEREEARTQTQMLYHQLQQVSNQQLKLIESMNSFQKYTRREITFLKEKINSLQTNMQKITDRIYLFIYLCFIDYWFS